MPIDREFLERTRTLFSPGMGTESAAFLLYSLARMLRPRNVLEVGLGYTTPFLALALADAREEYEFDRRVLRSEMDSPRRRSVLIPQYYRGDYRPILHGIDDFSLDLSTVPKVVEVLRDLGLDHFLKIHKGDFRGYSKSLSQNDKPLDLVWFDCGGPHEYVDFIREYWSLINQNHGALILHFTYWKVAMDNQGETVNRMISSPIVNEIKRQELEMGVAARFEVLSLLEPHKFRQGSITLVRKLAPQSLCREQDFVTEIGQLTGERWEDFPRLS